MRATRRRTVWICVAAWVSIFLAGGVAWAGGSPLEFERTAYQPGDLAVARTTFGNGCCDRGTPEEGPYFVYLYEGDYWDGPPDLPQNAIRVAEIEVEGASLYSAHVEFVVPDLPPGTYKVTHCNDPCSKFLGDITHGDFRIVDSAVEARTLGRLERFQSRIESLTYPLQGLRPRIDRLTVRVKHLEAEMETMSAEITELKEQAARAKAAASPERGEGVDSTALAASGLVVAALAAALVRRPHRSSRERRAS